LKETLKSSEAEINSEWNKARDVNRMISRTLLWRNEWELAFIWFSQSYFRKYHNPKTRQAVILGYTA
jgi:hypothetical protein